MPRKDAKPKIESAVTSPRGERTPLPRDFYSRPTLEVAPDLLGKLLVTRVRGVVTAGRIVEVEAYLGERDRASHACRKVGITPRNAGMFGEAGHAYVYLIYGMHHCFNVVTEVVGVAGAVLVRALEPVEGFAAMARRRGITLEMEREPATPPDIDAIRVRDRARLVSGPGRLCAALAIDRTFDREALDGSRIQVASDAGSTIPRDRIATSSRIGVGYAGEWASRPYRFFVRDHPCVSRIPGVPRSRPKRPEPPH